MAGGLRERQGAAGCGQTSDESPGIATPTASAGRHRMVPGFRIPGLVCGPAGLEIATLIGL
jgi:hypothetical protein